MSGMPRFLYAAAAMAGSLYATVAEANWLRAETESFIIYSDGNEKSLREFAQTLQRFDKTLRVLTNVAFEGEENKLPIYLLPTGKDVAKLATGSRGGSISGFYMPARDGSFALSHR